MTKNNNKGSAKKKLLPAVAMLTTSAVMLSTATYAWFTMNREVEVNGIQMTATVPEDLQISLGEITGGSDANSLGKSASFLAQTSGVVNPPADQDDLDPFDWSNTIDISKYYQFGKLIPASSTNGQNIYFTPDAKDVGKTLKDAAQSYAAITGNTAGEAGTGAATSHINKTNGPDGWLDGTGDYATSGAYKTASAWNTSNDDGYYIDIPIWLRTSSTSAPDIFVTGYITQGIKPATTDDDDLYQAVRVAILNADYTATNGVINLNDGNTYPADANSTVSIIDSGNANANFSLTNINALNNTGTMSASTYGNVDVNNGSSRIGTLEANAQNSSSQYGAGTKFIIRVWLEGDDVNCWNANAGQDWAISLKFMTSALPGGSST